MTFEEFDKHVRTKSMYETIYRDSEGRDILVIRMLDAYGLLARTTRTREWVGLTDEERAECWRSSAKQSAINIEAKIKEKNT